MSYADVDQLRIYLPNNSSTETQDFGALLERVSSLLDEALGFSFGGQMVTRVLDTRASEYLWLPPPGAEPDTAVTVTENAVSLVADTDFVVDPDGLYLMRIDSSGQPQSWLKGRRYVTVSYAPRQAPQALVEAELEEAVSTWNGKSAGFSGVVGVQGSTQMVHPHSLLPKTQMLLKSLRNRYGEGWGVY